MPENNLKLFRTTQGTAEYRERYESTLDLWHPQAQPLAVDTRFGVTRVNAAGSPDLPALVLIHGFGFSSTQWYPNIPALSPHFRIYAPDVPDQFGMSVLSQAIQTRENYALWLGDLLDNLGISQTALAGHSYGGWLATNYTISQPERVTRLALIAPAGTFVPLSSPVFPARHRGRLTCRSAQPGFSGLQHGALDDHPAPCGGFGNCRAVQGGDEKHGACAGWDAGSFHFR